MATGRLAPLLWALVAGSVAATAELWIRRASRAMAVSAAFVPARAFPGEQVLLRLCVRNEGRVRLPLVQVSVTLPEGVERVGEGNRISARRAQIRCSLARATEASFEIPVEVTERGEYWVESAEAIAVDPFGLAHVLQEIPCPTALVVMPEQRVEIPLRIRRRLPFGTPTPGARLFEDREYLAGVRDYEPGDSLNRVHWRLTAHTGDLQTMLFEPTRTAEVLFAIDVSGGEPFWWWVAPAVAEDAIGWASFLVRQAIESDWRVGLVANTHLLKGRGPIRVPSSRAPGHEAALFSVLAKMPNQPTGDLGPVLHEVGRRLVRRTTVVVISAWPGAGLRREIELLRRRGTSVVHLSPLAPAGEDTA
jgi:uncharacterized protein (DUF58 family)